MSEEKEFDISATLQLDPDTIAVVEGRNPRTIFDEAALLDLSQSMLAVGFMSNKPIEVRYLQATKTFELAGDGERRLRAAKIVKTAKPDFQVWAVEVNADVTEAAMLKSMITSNLNNQSLTPLEEAHAYQKYMDMREGINRKDAAEELGIKYAHLQECLALLDTDKTDESVREALESGQLDSTTAKKIVKKTTGRKRNKTDEEKEKVKEKQKELVDKIVSAPPEERKQIKSQVLNKELQGQKVTTAQRKLGRDLVAETAAIATGTLSQPKFVEQTFLEEDRPFDEETFINTANDDTLRAYLIGRIAGAASALLQDPAAFILASTKKKASVVTKPVPEPPQDQKPDIKEQALAEAVTKSLPPTVPVAEEDPENELPLDIEGAVAILKEAL